MKIDTKSIITWLKKHLAIVAITLGFLGTIVIVMDSFEPVNHIINKISPWHDISEGIKVLDDMTYKGNSRQSILNKEQVGFGDILKIIQANRPEFVDDTIIAIGQYKPTGKISVGPIGGLSQDIIPDSRLIFVIVKNSPNETKIVIERPLFDEWRKNYREKYFLEVGIFLIWVGFIVAIVEHFISQ